MLKWNLDSVQLVEEMERQSVNVEAKVRRLLGRNGLVLSSEGQEDLHGAVMEAIGAKLEAEGALTFLRGHSD